MLLLTSYMDETGHSDNPNFHFGGMAGFVAPFKTWEVLGEIWQEILDVFKLKEPFHAKDFAHFQGQFKGWSETKRQLLYGPLVKLIVKSNAIPIGAIVSLNDFKTLSERQQKMFLDPYYLAFQTCTRGAALVAVGHTPFVDVETLRLVGTGAELPEPEQERVAMVYSYNKEFGTIQSQEINSMDQAGRAEGLWHAIKQSTMFGKWMGSYASDSPKAIVQLQAADLFAYELAKEFQTLRDKPERPMRYGLRQILQLVTSQPPMIRLFDRKELLRLIVEGDLPYKEGTEELGNIDAQLESAQRERMEWLKRRGGIDIGPSDEDLP